MLRNIARHAGWPESATAGALGLALAGPRRYGERIVDDPFLNAEARKDAAPGDIGPRARSACGGMPAGGGGLRRTRASRLTAARDLQDLRDIEMRFQMIGERVQRGFYAAS